MLVAEGDQLTAVTAGPEMRVRWSVPAEVAMAGSVFVTAHLLLELVEVMDFAEVRLATDNRGHLRVRSVGIDTAIPGLPLLLAPQLNLAAGWSGQLNASELLAACAQVRIAAARGEAKPILTGVLMRFEDESVVLVGTDGSRLAERRLNAIGTGRGRCDVIVPAKSLAEIEHLLEHAGDAVDCAADSSGRAISLQAPGFEIVAMGLEGKFPSYAHLIPQAVATSCVVDVAEALRRLAAAAAFAPDDARKVTLRFRRAGLTIKGGAPDLGTSLATAAGRVTGAEGEVQINPDHLESGLRAVGSEQVVIEMSPAPAILVMRPEPRIDYVFIVMPYVTQAAEQRVKVRPDTTFKAPFSVGALDEPSHKP